jgi:hypothetical protein
MSPAGGLPKDGASNKILFASAVDALREPDRIRGFPPGTLKGEPETSRETCLGANLIFDNLVVDLPLDF